MEKDEVPTQLRHNVIVKYIYERKNNKLARQKS